MAHTKRYIFYAVLLYAVCLFPQNKSAWLPVIGSAFAENASYKVLQTICDEAGGRLVGTSQNLKGIEILKNELTKIGIEAKLENFTFPGWIRGDDGLKMTEPIERKLKAAALGYTNKTDAFTAEVVYAKNGFGEEYANGRINGKIALVTQEAPSGREALLRYEAIDTAAKYGAKAILFINTKPGMSLLCGTGDFTGQPTKIPAFSISYEEGKWIERLFESDKTVKMEIITKSYCKEMQAPNLVATLPGKVKEKIVVGAHFDSWDLGQGSIDNGVGTAVLFDVARLLKTFSYNNYYTVEFVWFNGEELGLWGSQRYVEMHSQESILVMLNMDMIGSPTGYNVLGFEELIPAFNGILKELNGFNLSAGVVNHPYTNSDHIPFMFRGIPVFSMESRLDDESVRYYHDAGDTFDKVNIKHLSEAAAVVGVTIKELANNNSLKLKNKTDKEMAAIFKKHGLDKRLKRQHEWIYKDE